MTNSKKIISLSAMILTIAATSISAFALNPTSAATLTPATKVVTNNVRSNTVETNCRNLMLDESGALVTSKTFESNLNAAIKNGAINANDKDYYLDLYNSCTTVSNRGGCCNNRYAR